MGGGQRYARVSTNQEQETTKATEEDAQWFLFFSLMTLLQYLSSLLLAIQPLPCFPPPPPPACPTPPSKSPYCPGGTSTAPPSVVAIDDRAIDPRAPAGWLLLLLEWWAGTWGRWKRGLVGDEVADEDEGGPTTGTCWSPEWGEDDIAGFCRAIS